MRALFRFLFDLAGLMAILFTGWALAVVWAAAWGALP